MVCYIHFIIIILNSLPSNHSLVTMVFSENPRKIHHLVPCLRTQPYRSRSQTWTMGRNFQSCSEEKTVSIFWHGISRICIRYVYNSPPYKLKWKMLIVNVNKNEQEQRICLLKSPCLHNLVQDLWPSHSAI